MKHRVHATVTKKWCHIICTIAPDCEQLKIPATARFCERLIGKACANPGWQIDEVSLTRSRLRLLARAPASLSRKAIIMKIQRAASAAIQHTGNRTVFRRSVWGEHAWCFVLRNAYSVSAVRRNILGLSRSDTVPTVVFGPIPWRRTVRQ